MKRLWPSPSLRSGRRNLDERAPATSVLRPLFRARSSEHRRVVAVRAAAYSNGLDPDGTPKICSDYGEWDDISM